MPDDTPTHVVDAGATKTRCGIALYNNGKHPYPYVGADHVGAHVSKRGMVVCPACADHDNDKEKP